MHGIFVPNFEVSGIDIALWADLDKWLQLYLPTMRCATSTELLGRHFAADDGAGLQKFFTYLLKLPVSLERKVKHESFIAGVFSRLKKKIAALDREKQEELVNALVNDLNKTGEHRLATPLRHNWTSGDIHTSAAEDDETVDTDSGEGDLVMIRGNNASGICSKIRELGFEAHCVTESGLQITENSVRSPWPTACALCWRKMTAATQF